MNDMFATTGNEVAKKVVTHAQIVVSGDAEKPYYGIEYIVDGDNETYCGYGSYNLGFVFAWLAECFEIVGKEVAQNE